MSGALELGARVREDIAAVEALRSGSCAPPWACCADPGRSAHGEDFAIVALRVGEELHDAAGEAGTGAGGDDVARPGAAHEEFETERWGVVLALDARWGAHRTLSTVPYEEREAAGAVVPPFFAELIELGYSGDLQIWGEGGRSAGIGVGQMDKEEPVVLFAVVLGPACDAGRPVRPDRPGRGT
ncbi:hypothetical protein [Streptomyces sp. NPDC058193]|uniref:hypothetical protein n=1 Tax=Streptomyces sp. NPDC058193 TaxID=3346373 RepID=UPI0036EBE605